jgi:hypothetical protein
VSTNQGTEGAGPIAGTPLGSAHPRTSFPRGIEALIRKAAADPAFRKQLLEQRAGAAAAAGLELVPAEQAMLQAMESKDSALKLKLMAWLAKRRAVNIKLTPAATYQKRALIGLTLLGPQASNAVPSIQKFLTNGASARNWELQQFGAEALEKITGKDHDSSRP